MDPTEQFRYSVLAKFSLCFAGISLAFYTFRIWMNGKKHITVENCKNKVAIVTGASKGIGKMTALALAKRGIHVIMACRDMKRGTDAQDEIISKTGNENVKCMHLDLGTFKSIRKFVDEFLSTDLRLDILINNASIMRMDRDETEEGIEQTVGVNHFGHFLLTMLLLKRMSQSTPSRVINVSNWVHRCVEIDRTDLMNERHYNGALAYARSKLTNIYFTIALDNRLEDSGINCNAVHPGMVLTDLFKRMDNSSMFGIHRWICILLSKLLCKSEYACAQTILFAALDFNVQNIGGIYISNGDAGQMGNNAYDDDLMEWLWRKSEEITSVKFTDCLNHKNKYTISHY